MKKTFIEKCIFGLIGATLFVPLVVNSTHFIFPFIVPKVLLFRSLVALMLGAYLMLLVHSWKEYKPKLNALHVSVILFYISFALSTFIGVDWYRSFWDNHERMLGLFTITHYIVYFFVLTTVVKDAAVWKWFLRLFLISGILSICVALIQKVNPDFLLNRGNTRVASTLGNPIYVGSYGLFLFFLGLLVAMREYKHQFWRWFGVAGAVFGFIGIFMSGSRGPLFAFIFSIGLMFLLYAYAYRKQKKIRNIFVAITLGGVVCLGLLYSFRTTPVVGEIPALGRLLNTNIQNSEKPNTRVMAWGISLEAWQDRPIFGWGPNNYYYAFNQYYRPEFLQRGWGETWFDNAHSVPMNTLAVQGIVGFVVYIALFIAAVYMLFRAYHNKRIETHTFVLLTTFFIAHFVENFFVFENITSYLSFFFLVAFVAHVTDDTSEVLQKIKSVIPSSTRVSMPLGVGVALIFVIFIFVTNVNPARANMRTLDAIRTLSAGKLDGDPVKLYETATKVPSPHVDDIRNDFIRTLQLSVNKRIKNQDGTGALSLIDFSHTELQKNVFLHPLDIRVSMQQAEFSRMRAQLKGQMSQDPREDLRDAERILEGVRDLSPERQQVHYTLATVYLLQGKNDEAIALFEESIAYDPKVGEGYWRLAGVYRDLGELEKAMDVVRDAEERGVEFKNPGKNVVDRIRGEYQRSKKEK